MTHKLILVRHGLSDWNAQNRFTGWTDVDLSEAGMAEAHLAAKNLQAENLEIDVCYTSVLKRAIRTLWVILDDLDLMWLPVHRSWKLNERHYGALQGLNKSETAAKYGDAQVHVWRRSFDIPPGPLDENDERHPRFDRRYRDVPADQLPATESLKETLVRVLEYWNEEIAPAIQSGKTVMIAAHGNSLRALVKHLLKISDEEISELNIPTAIPWLFELDDNLQPISNRYLGDPEAAKAAAEAVKKQSQAKK